jgi:hypothetical protein
MDLGGGEGMADMVKLKPVHNAIYAFIPNALNAWITVPLKALIWPIHQK